MLSTTETLLQKEDLWKLITIEPQEVAQVAPPIDQEDESEEDGDVVSSSHLIH